MIEAVDAMIARGGAYAPRWGWHDQHRAADGTAAYLPALQQVRIEYAAFLEDLRDAGTFDGKCLQLGLGECQASHDAWDMLFYWGAVSIDLGRSLAGRDAFPGHNTHDEAARAFAAERGPYTMLFVDAGHLEPDVAADHRDYAALVRPGGVVAFHDALERQGFAIDVHRYIASLQGVRVIGSEVGIAWIQQP